MTLRNVNYVRVKNLTPEQKIEMGIKVQGGIVAIETHNEEYKQKIKVLSKGLVNYILNGN